MRNYLTLFFSLLIIAGCGGGAGGGAGGPTSSTIPVGVVSGTSFDGLVINGNVAVYDFTTGSKGVLLGQATTDGQGLYSLSLQIESRPVLLELTGGYYVEEADNANVALLSNHKLTAVANYTTGAALKVAVTTYSYLAAGLAQYEISKGTAVSTAIDNANQRISNLVGVNILTTTPKEITDVANASASLTPELRYGFLAGAISLWTYNHTPSTAAAHLAPYTSIDFAQTLYQDISADGVLDGFGVDSTGAKAQLSFGTTPLSPAVYRLGIGTAIVQMAANANNKTGLTGAQVLSFADSYIASTDLMFNNVAPTTFVASVTGVTFPANNQWVGGSVSLIPTASSPFGIGSVALIVDGVTVSNSSGVVPATFTINSASYADGAHSITVQLTDGGGFITTSSITSKFDNTSPTATGGADFLIYSWAGTSTDTGSGVYSVKDLTNGAISYPTSTGFWSIPYLGSNWSDTYQVRDNVGNCSKYTGTIGAGNVMFWTLLATSYTC
jgi:hypothetical protein